MGLEHAEIRELLDTGSGGVSESTLNRLLREAGDRGILDRTPRIAIPLVPPFESFLDEVLLPVEARELQSRYPASVGGPVRVLVVPAHEDRARTIARVGIAGAMLILRAIVAFQDEDTRERRVERVAFSWGYHPRAVARGIARGLARITPETAGRLQVFSATGVFTSDPSSADHTASANALLFGQTLCWNLEVTPFGEEGADQAAALPRPTLMSLPLVLPFDADADEDNEEEEAVRILWGYVGTDAAVRRIYGDRWAQSRWAEPRGDAADPASPPDAEEPLLRRADVFVTSVGSREGTNSKAAFGGDYQKLVSTIGPIEGDISAQFVPAASATPEQEERILRLNARHILSPTLDELRVISQRARRDRRLGVLLVASGVDKVAVLKRLLEMRWIVDHLVIDSQLAAGLCGQPG
jgi:hypothetical protein